MPSDWIYHADGVGTAVSTGHDLDGTLASVTVELDSFKYRKWTEDEDEIEAAGKDPKHMPYNADEDAYEEFRDGTHATLHFDVIAGSATLTSIEPEDGESVRPRHMKILRAAERVVGNIQEVDAVTPSLHPFLEEYEGAEGIFIERLDSK